MLSVETGLAAGIVARVNAIRAQHGLARLEVTKALASAAAAHSRDMAETGLFQHDSSGGRAYWQRIRHFYPDSGFRRWSVGETLLWESPDVSAQATVFTWLASPTHRKILLDPAWHDIGVAALHATKAPGDFHGLEISVITADFGARTR